MIEAELRQLFEDTIARIGRYRVTTPDGAANVAGELEDAANSLLDIARTLRGED